MHKNLLIHIELHHCGINYVP